MNTFLSHAKVGACLAVLVLALQGCGTNETDPATVAPTLNLSMAATPDAFTPVTINFSVTAPAGSKRVPSGSVSFSCVSSTGTSCFQGTEDVPDGTYKGPVLPEGTFTITASYTGDRYFSAEQTTQSVQVTAPFSVTAGSTVALCPGCSVALPITVSKLSSYSGDVDIAIAGLPSGVTYSPASIPAGSTAAVTLTAATNADGEDFNIYTSTAFADKLLTLTGTVAGNFATTANATLHMQIEDTTFTPTQTYLPVMNITTASGAAITSEDDYVAGSVTIMDPKNSSNNYSGTMTIKGHGNSTWLMPKKPYNLKLDSKAKLLGMPKEKKWVLLANYDDKSMLRDMVASELGNRLGMVWSPRSAFVECYINGAYQGVYQLAEKVDIDSNRVDIDELDDTVTSGEDLTGGYLVEIDQHQSDTFVFFSPSGLPMGSDDPDPPNTQQQNYLVGAVAAAEGALYSTNFTDSQTGWPAYFDQDSAVKWYLAEEIMNNQDGDFFSSDYFYKKRSDPHLYMGPLWDFDISSGNVNYSTSVDPSQMWIRNAASWYERLFQDPAFQTATATQYTASRAQIADILNFIDTQAATLQNAADNNYHRWRTLNLGVWPNSEVGGSYNAEVAFLKSWLTAHLAAMDTVYLQQADTSKSSGSQPHNRIMNMQ